MTDKGVGPFVLALDSSRAHLTEENVKWCKKNDIFLVIIPGGLTSVLQPMDLRVNAPYKYHLRELMYKWVEWAWEERGDTVGGFPEPGNQDLLTMAQTAWDNVDIDLIQMGFKSTGRWLS